MFSNGIYSLLPVIRKLDQNIIVVLGTFSSALSYLVNLYLEKTVLPPAVYWLCCFVSGIPHYCLGGGGVPKSFLGCGVPMARVPPHLGLGYPLHGTGVPPHTQDWGTLPGIGHTPGLGYALPWTGVLLPQKEPGSSHWVPPRKDKNIVEVLWDGDELWVWTDAHLWKQYLPHPSDEGGNNKKCYCLHQLW